MTEYTSPLLFMETCGEKNKVVSQFYDHLTEVRTQHLGLNSSHTHADITEPGKKKITNRRKTDWCSSRMHTDDPWSTTRVRKAQGKPKPSRMSKILLPMEFDTAMSPMPEERQERLN